MVLIYHGGVEFSQRREGRIFIKGAIAAVKFKPFEAPLNFVELKFVLWKIWNQVVYSEVVKYAKPTQTRIYFFR